MKYITISFTDTAEDDATELDDVVLAGRALDSLVQLYLDKPGDALDYVDVKIEEVDD